LTVCSNQLQISTNQCMRITNLCFTFKHKLPQPNSIQFKLPPNQIKEYQTNYRIRARGFQISMVPSTSPPATRPSENCSEADPPAALPHERRLKRSELGASPASGNSRSSDWKSSLKISRLADELKDRSTAPAIVPAATYGASGASATDADLLTPFIHAICPYPQIQIQIRVFISLYIYI
jgi:hypothetical protein